MVSKGSIINKSSFQDPKITKNGLPNSLLNDAAPIGASIIWSGEAILLGNKSVFSQLFSLTRKFETLTQQFQTSV